MERLTYPVAGMSDNDAPGNGVSYTYYQDADGNETQQVKQATFTIPTVPVSQNGDGQTYSWVTQYDLDGNPTWRKDLRGYIQHWIWSNGVNTQWIQDVDTNQIEGAPAGWTTPADGGLNLVYENQHDSMGREIRRMFPWHEAVLDAESKEAISVRTTYFKVYRDDLRQIWRATGYATGSAPHYNFDVMGPVSISQRDPSGRVTDNIQAIRACECAGGPLQSNESFPQSTWTRWRKYIYDSFGNRIAERIYHDIPESGEGEPGINYTDTTYGYDDTNRQNRTRTPDGTITWTVFSSANRPIETWVGTDDTGATNSDPANNNHSDGNNMVKVTAFVFDNGTAGGNGLLTQTTAFVDASGNNDRVTNFAYDYRDQLDTTTVNDGTTSFVTQNTYDNLGRRTQVDAYHTEVDDDNLTGRSKSYIDNRNRTYKAETFGVDVSTTPPTVGNALTSESWFDAEGNALKSTQAGSQAFTKTVFDSLNRDTENYLCVNPGTSSDDNNVANDTVLEQNHATYDDASNVIGVSHARRFADAPITDKGALNGPNGSQPKARIGYAFTWFDPIGRSVAAANYGTHGGLEPNRPDTVPDRSDIVLVDGTVYAPDGTVEASIDAQGKEPRKVRNAAGRIIRSIENYDPVASATDTGANRTTEYAYTPGGQLECLTLKNSVTGDQLTRWIYGSTLSDSSIARGDLLRSKIYPMSDDTASPLDDGLDGEYERIEYGYNRQGQITEMKDPNGTVHDYAFDELGRPTEDDVSTFASGIDQAIDRIATTYDDKKGLVARVTSYNGATLVNQIEYEYDDFGQLSVDKQEHEGAVDSSTPEVQYGHADGSDNTTRLTSLTYPDGNKVIDYSYGSTDSIDDLLSRIASFKINGESTDLVNYTCMGAGRFEDYVKVEYPQPGIELSYIKSASEPVGDAGDPYTGLDRFGRTVDMRWQTTGASPDIRDHFQWGYDRASNRTWRANLAPTGAEQDHHYGYDGLYQVKNDALGNLNINRSAIGGIPAEQESFDYDPTGNWLNYKKDEDGSTTIDQSRVNNRDNQVTQFDSSNAGVSYDKTGNALQMPPDKSGDYSKFYQLSWDAWNRLVKVEDHDDNIIASYAYDGATRRTTKTVGTTTTHYYYSDGWKPLEEREGTSTGAKAQYVWGQRPTHRDELVPRDRDNNGSDERLYALMDYYSCTSIVDTSGVVQERYDYSAFGERRIMAADFSDRASSSFDWVFGFQGQFEDAETSYLNYGYRYFSPHIGRWLSRDPIGEAVFFEKYTKTLSLVDQGFASKQIYLPSYGFVLNNPINIYDKHGAILITTAWTIFSLGMAASNIILGCIACYHMKKCIERAEAFVKLAVKTLDGDEAYLYILHVRPGSECVDLFGVDCGTRFIRATFWIVGQVLVLRYAAV